MPNADVQHAYSPANMEHYQVFQSPSVPPISGKDLFLKFSRMGSRECDQDVWSRIVHRDVESSIELNRPPLLLERRIRTWPIQQRLERFLQEPTAEVIDARETSCETFILRAQRLDSQRRTDAALDLIYDSIDGMMRKGEFSRLNLLLPQLNVNDLSADILLGLLTATLPARSRLSCRKEFYCDAEASLRDRDELEDGLLTGLE